MEDTHSLACFKLNFSSCIGKASISALNKIFFPEYFPFIVAIIPVPERSLYGIFNFSNSFKCDVSNLISGKNGNLSK